MPPEVEAELRNTMGLVYTALGHDDEAEQMHQQALLLRQGLFGDEHLDVAGSKANLGEVLHRKRDLDTAEALLRQAQS